MSENLWFSTSRSHILVVALATAAGLSCKSQMQTRQMNGGSGRSADGGATLPNQNTGNSANGGFGGSNDTTGGTGGSGGPTSGNTGTPLPGDITGDGTSSGGDPAQNPGTTTGGTTTSSSGSTTTSTSTSSSTTTSGATTEIVDFPSLAYDGEGKLFNNGSDFKVTQQISIDVDATKFNLHVDNFRSSTSQVDKKIKVQVGTSAYDRTPKTDLDYLSQHGFVNELYALYADSVTARDGTQYVFSKPLPVYVVPAAASRYDTLAAGDKVYTARVNGGAFNVTMTLHLVSRTATEVVLQSDMVITEDNKGDLYGKFPLNRRSTYHIDPVRKIVRKLHGLSNYNDNNKLEKIEIEFRVCRETYKASTENFDCTF